jgi:ABC-type branched-subunit amino acid transport system permease subunit
LEVFREFGVFRLVNFSILLVLIMIYRPQGLMGSWTLVKKQRRVATSTQ